MTEIWIPGNVPSLKNGKIKTRYGVVESKAVKDWKKNTKEYWKKYSIYFYSIWSNSPAPMFIHLTFIRKGAALFDYFGPGETIMDEMVNHTWINDDNAYQVVPVFGKFKVDKMNSGVIIRLIKQPKYEFI